MPETTSPLSITLLLPNSLVKDIDSKRGALHRNQACVILIRHALANQTDLIANVAVGDKEDSNAANS